MENGGYKLKKITDSITLLYGFAEECCMYAVNGRDKILLVDTGMGTGDLKAALNSISHGKPMLAVNTHGHADHAGGNDQFPEVMLHRGTYNDISNVEEERKTLPHDEAHAGVEKYKWSKVPVCDGDIIDLGDRTLEVIETPGHTPGCICLLDKEDRALFCGDLVVSNDHCTHMLAYVEWFKFSTVSIETFLRSLNKIKSRESEFDILLGGHDAFALDKKYLYELIELCESIINKTAKPYHPVLPAHYGNIQCWKVDGQNTAILYHDEVIFDKKEQWEEC
ncbi:MAG: MBL fold metallo-hydrolase [Oscillospiraceae bacterium]|nr:MBL fold metallo-hydrolase [Oscillospiraceae bacterium]